MTIFTR